MCLQAQRYLAANGWDIEAAVTEFFAEQDEALQDTSTGGGQPSGQTLGDSSASSSAGPQQSSSAGKNRSSKKFATLGDYTSGGGDSSDEDDQENQDLFAGGEKSGLAVQNPDDLKKKIIEKATR